MRRSLLRAPCWTSRGRGRGGAVTAARSTRSTGGNLAEKRLHTVDHPGPVEPGPVAGVDLLQLDLAAERVGVAAAELGADVGVARGPHDERRAAQLAEPLAVRRQHLWGRRPVEPQDGPLGAVVEVVVGSVGDLRRQRAAEGEAGAEAHRHAARARQERLPVPARRGHAVQVEDRGVAALAPEDLEPRHLRAPSGDLHAPLHTIPALHGRPPQAAQDRRQAGRRVRPPGAASARRAGGRAGADGAVAEHERPQPRRRLGTPPRALPGVGRGAARADRGDRGRDPPRWARPDQVRAHQADPRRDRRGRPGAPGGRPARRGAGRAGGAAGRGQEDGRLRAPVRLRAPGRAGRHARVPGRRSARAVAAEGVVRPRTRRAAAPVRGRRRVRLRDPRAADPARPAHLRGPLAAMRGVPAAADVPGGEAPAGGRSRMSEEMSNLRRGPSPRLGERRSTLRRGPSPRLGERRLRRVAELALIAIAAVWGLTFVMVQDAIALLPTMAFLAYRFIPAALIVAVIFWRPLRQLPAAGWRARLLVGVFPAGGYIFQTLGLEETSASNTGF